MRSQTGVDQYVKRETEARKRRLAASDFLRKGYRVPVGHVALRLNRSLDREYLWLKKADVIKFLEDVPHLEVVGDFVYRVEDLERGLFDDVYRVEDVEGLFAMGLCQLARVKESMSWITMAGRAILILLDRYKLYNDSYWDNHGGLQVQQFQKSQQRIKDTRQSLIVMASWTCLQLESDILAELKLPSSGIQAVENLLLMPHKVNEDESYSGLESDGRPDDYDIMLIYYSAQLFLRRRLNKVHQEMYGKDVLGKPLDEVLEILTSHESILEHWREGLPDTLQWKDDDPPPQDILNARLRAKYWGARYVINRPFLDYCLHIMPHTRDMTVEAAATDGYGHPRDKADIHLFSAIKLARQDQIFEASERCIYAAMKSTVAFDGILFDAGARLVVTNIHGTAHA